MIVNIYRIYNIQNNKSFIGCTKDIKKRIKTIKKECTNFETTSYLYLDIQKYKLKNFKCEILQQIECFDKSKQYDIDYLYTYYVQKYNSVYPNGYNKSEQNNYILTFNKSKYIVNDFIKIPELNNQLSDLAGRLRTRSFVNKEKEQNKQICGIYRIYNIENNKSYIGQSTNIISRWYSHYLTPVTEFDKTLRNLGIEKFNFEILEECPIEQLNEKEKYYISYYNSYNNGYNKTQGGDYNREYNLADWQV